MDGIYSGAHLFSYLNIKLDSVWQYQTPDVTRPKIILSRRLGSWKTSMTSSEESISGDHLQRSTIENFWTLANCTKFQHILPENELGSWNKSACKIITKCVDEDHAFAFFLSTVEGIMFYGDTLQFRVKIVTFYESYLQGSSLPQNSDLVLRKKEKFLLLSILRNGDKNTLLAILTKVS